ncbi:MAG: RluA family pseudouridine synthase [Nitrospinae bacterium]|nr:RluA family pseudouridine synthase [Nitrospinota bacterium]
MARLHFLPPTEQVYESYAPSRYYGYPLSGYFAERFTYLKEQEWILRIQAGMITVNGRKEPPDYILKEHDRIVTCMGLRVEPPANRSLEILYEDERVRVFNKAAPIPIHPSGRYFKNSMTELLKDVYPGEVPRPVQRLDVITTGVLVFARTRPAAAFLMNEFARNRVEKEYLAIVEGVPRDRKFTIDAPIGKIEGSARGVGENALNPKPAETGVEWLGALDGRSLVKAVPRSGRTNQIRVHLASVGLPVLNDPVYGRRGGVSPRIVPPRACAEAALPPEVSPAALWTESPVLQYGLHARRLRFRCFDDCMEIAAPWPEHFQPFIDAAGINP